MMRFWRSMWNKLLHHFLPSPHNTFRPYLLRKPWLIFFLTVVLTAEGIFVASIIARQSTFDFPAAVVPAQVIALTNVEREQSSTSLLAENALLSLAAQAKAEDMAREGYFSHTGPDGKEPWRWIEEAGYLYQYAGENLAVRFSESADVVRAWMDSPTHRDNIVKPLYTEIGIGVAEGMFEDAPATFVVQYFGTPRIAQAEEAVDPIQDERVVQALESGAAEVQGVSTAQENSAPTSSPAATLEPPMEVYTPPQSVSTPLDEVAEVVAASGESSTWIIGVVLLVLIFALALAFFIHIEIQSHELLFGGTLVASVALMFLVLNMQVPGVRSQNQTASVALSRSAVLMGESGASIEFATSSPLLEEYSE